jgi:hypothetical protein
MILVECVHFQRRPPTRRWSNRESSPPSAVGVHWLHDPSIRKPMTRTTNRELVGTYVSGGRAESAEARRSRAIARGARELIDLRDAPRANHPRIVARTDVRPHSRPLAAVDEGVYLRAARRTASATAFGRESRSRSTFLRAGGAVGPERRNPAGRAQHRFEKLALTPWRPIPRGTKPTYEGGGTRARELPAADGRCGGARSLIAFNVYSRPRETSLRAEGEDREAISAKGTVRPVPW